MTEVFDKLIDLVTRRDELEAQIDEIRREQRAEAVAKVFELMDSIGLTTADLTPHRPAKQSHREKFRDPESGKTWGGLGKRPGWLRDGIAAGRSLDDYRNQA